MEIIPGLTNLCSLGRGSTATVSLASDPISARLLAVKSAEVSVSSPIQHEHRILSSLSSPHIISCYGSCISDYQFHLLLEFASCGSLFDHITSVNMRWTSGVHLTQADDILTWRWTTTGRYTANSVHRQMVGAGKTRWRFVKIWKLNIPPTVRLFLFLLLKGKLLTRDVLRRRNFNCQTNCAMCNRNLEETAYHLFFQCEYALSIWRKLGIGISRQDATVDCIWAKVDAGDHILGVCVMWAIWRSHNLQIFEERRVPLDITVRWIIQESTMWKKYC